MPSNPEAVILVIEILWWTLIARNEAICQDKDQQLPSVAILLSTIQRLQYEHSRNSYCNSGTYLDSFNPIIL